MNKKKIEQLQTFEGNLQQVLLQKQQFQTQFAEVESAKEETSTTDAAYKIVGGVMIKVDKESLLKELNQRAEILGLRLKSVETQEESLKSKISEMRSEVLKSIKDK